MNTPPIDYVAAGFWLAVIQLVCTGLVGVYVAVVARTRWNARLIHAHEKAVDARLDEIENEIARLQVAAEHAPDAESLRRIHQRIDTLTSDLAEKSGIIDGLKSSLGRVNDHLISRGQ